MGINKNSLSFLSDLINNNNREWFAENKSRYQESLEDFKNVVSEIESIMSTYDVLDKTKVFRIYRDIRFSKDKTPYKQHFAARFARLGPKRRGSYYLSISPQESFVGGGFWKPESKDMKYIREGIASNPELITDAINDSTFKSKFGTLSGEELKTSPRGYTEDHPQIDLLRKKQFLIMKKYKVNEVTKGDFAKVVAEDFQAMLPTFEAITEYLLFDQNGVER